jgi:hypothetical protein
MELPLATSLFRVRSLCPSTDGRFAKPFGMFGVPDGIRTRVTAVKVAEQTATVRKNTRSKPSERVLCAAADGKWVHRRSTESLLPPRRGSTDFFPDGPLQCGLLALGN